ncbi:MAG: hypothetical protein LBR26_00795 [Prevotella sp.]|jgi:hypothetical protein|nr:hypothetical protein [Prevotella sp.]
MKKLFAFKKQGALYRFLLIGMIMFPLCAESVDSRLKKLSEEVNTGCPIMLDQWTRLDSCAACPNLTMKYYLTLNEVTVTDTSLFKSRLKPQITSSLKINPDMKFFKENNIAMQYRYGDPAGKYLFSVAVSPENYNKNN